MTDPTSPGARRRTAGLVFIFVTVLLDVVALGLVIPVLPRLIERFMGGDMPAAARVIGLFGTLWAAVNFFAAPVLGSLSDRFGRRPVVLLSNFGLGLDYLLMALAPSLSWLVVGRVISGVTAASIPTAFAYVADITPPEKRAGAFGLLGAGFGVGFVLGPALGGLLGGVDPRLPFWLAAGLSLLNAAYGLIVLPESLPPDRRRPFVWGRANPIGALGILRNNARLVGLGVMCFIGGLAHVVMPSVFVLYADYRFGWHERAVGLTLAVMGVCAMVVQGVLVRVVVEKLGERVALLLGLFAGASAMIIYGLARTPWEFCAAIPVMSLWGLSGPSMQGLMSRRVSASEQGQLQGVTQSIMAIAELMGPTIFSSAFAYFIAKERSFTLPGAPFLLSGALLALSFAVGVQVTRERSARASLSADPQASP